MTEVVQGQVIEPGPPPRASRVRDQLLAPYTGSRVRNFILKELDERMGKGDYAFTLSTIARKNGLPANAFISLLHDAFDSPNHDLHDFACEIQKRWAVCEEHLYGKMLDTAEAKSKWEGWATALERTRREDWVKPSEKAMSPPSQTLNIGTVEKLALIAASAGELTTGD